MDKAALVSWVKVHYWWTANIPEEMILRDRVVRWVRDRDFEAIEDAVRKKNAKMGRPKATVRHHAIVAAVAGVQEHHGVALTGDAGAFAVVAKALGMSASSVERIWYDLRKKS